MKPYKIFSMAMCTLLFFCLVYNGKFNFESNSIFVLVLDTIFSFIFPVAIFFSAWLISYIRKEDNKGLFNYYLKILLNLVLPYFLCMVPYIIYNFGINNLNFGEFIKILIEGNIVKQFAYIKTIIGLLIAFPVVEYFIKKNTKVTLIISLILSAIFSLFNLNIYIYTNFFNYLIYLSLGITFSYYKEKIIVFLRYKYFDIIPNFIWTLIFIFVTRIKILSFLNPIAEILYSISVAFLMTYYCYRWQGYHYRNRKYLFKSLIFNPPIVGVSLFLLVEIIIKVTSEILNTSLLTIPEVFVYMAGIIFILALHSIDKANEYLERKRMEKRRRLGLEE